MEEKVKGKGNQKSERDLLEEMRNLLIIIALKLGANSDEIGKSLGLSGVQIRKIKAGLAKGGKNGKEEQGP